MFGELYCTVDEARRWRARIRRNELPAGLELDLSVTEDFDRELIRQYPICLTIRSYQMDREAFEEALTDLALYPDETPTGGVIGGDGGFGWTPAVNFDYEGDNTMFGHVYVVPWPHTVRELTRPHSWDRVAGAIFRKYQYGP